MIAKLKWNMHVGLLEYIYRHLEMDAVKNMYKLYIIFY